MLELVTLGAQAISVALIAAWLTIGVSDNIRHPDMNRAITAEVLAMGRMQREYPSDYARVAHRAVTDPVAHNRAFRLVVLVELTGTALLWIGVAALVGALVGAVARPDARALALAGAATFTAIWGGFLIVGNYFCYWYCHEGAQNTHYQMTLWGLGTMIFLASV